MGGGRVGQLLATVDTGLVDTGLADTGLVDVPELSGCAEDLIFLYTLNWELLILIEDWKVLRLVCDDAFSLYGQ